MFCNYCGAPNPDDSSFCSACGKAVAAQVRQPGPPDKAPDPVGRRAHATTASAPPPAQPSSTTGARGLWIVGAIAATLAILVGAGVYFMARPRDDASLFAPATQRASVAPAVEVRPAPAPAAPAAPTSPAPEAAAAPPAPLPPTPSPAPQPPAAAPAPPPAPLTIVGEWRTNLIIGVGTLTLTGDGRYRVRNVFVDDSGIYTYAPDGTLRLQENGVFDHSITEWHAQLSPDGQSLSVIEPEGAAHVYTRVRD